MKLNELDEIQQDAYHWTTLVQNQRAWWRDKFIKKKVLCPGDWALLYDSKFNHFKGKFSTRWLGPYEIIEVFYNGSVHICTIDNDRTSFVVNVHRLKVYHKPLSRYHFLQEIRNDPILELIHAKDQPLAGSVN